MQTFKTIIGGTKEEAFETFPWLKEASFHDAEIDISGDWLIWKDGTWEYGTWKDGTWEYGFWKDGTWKGGTWKGGTWKKGFMWNNRLQTYETIKQVDGKFEVG